MTRSPRPARRLAILVSLALLAACGTAAPPQGNFRPEGGWTSGRFTLGSVDGRPIFITPDGKPFYAVSMVYAFDPEAGPYAGQLNWESVLWSLEAMKAHGFNTLNLYGDKFMPEIFAWCDRNGVAVVPRTCYLDGTDIEGERREYPDFMDPVFRAKVINHYDTFLQTAKEHPSFLALDMDHRWLFPLDWSGAKHGHTPMLGPAGIAHFPKWLEERYGAVSRLNETWGRSYRSFADVLRDPAIFSGGKALPLGRNPWRLDLVEYTNWTANDFLSALSRHLKSIDPQLLLTYTTEHPEVCPNPLTTLEHGIDFISPVHYNKREWYNRDWIAAGKSIYETLFHYDMQGLPVYIAETGWRTSPLDQWPQVTNYAYARPGDENHLAGLYLRQVTLLHALPWIVGWAHFKMYDKPAEGDFGYLRDDLLEKPIATVGRGLNRFQTIAPSAFPSPRLSFFYPPYMLAAEEAGMRQFSTLVQVLEFEALSDLESLAADADRSIGDATGIMLSDIVTQAAARFRERFVPFRFAPKIEEAAGVVVLAGNQSEVLSATDRAALDGRKTVTFARAGLYDERYRGGDGAPWYLSCVGLAGAAPPTSYRPISIDAAANHKASGPGSNLDAGDAFGAGFPASLAVLSGVPFRPVSAESFDNVQCRGQSVAIDAPAGASAIHVVAAVTGGDLAFPVKLVYADGSEETRFLGTALTDWKWPEGRANEIPAKNLAGRPRCAVRVSAAVHPLKRLAAIVLPDTPDAHLFAVTLEISSTGTNLPVEVTMGDAKIAGITPWAVFVPADAVPGERVLARFSDGRPAIVLSEDRRHAVFLFDALTWAGSRSAVSADLEALAKIVKRTLEAVEAAS